MKQIAASLLLILLIISCTSKDDSPNTDDQQMDDDEVPVLVNKLVKEVITNYFNNGSTITKTYSYDSDLRVTEVLYEFAPSNIDPVTYTYSYTEDRITALEISDGQSYQYNYTNGQITSGSWDFLDHHFDSEYAYDGSNNLITYTKHENGDTCVDTHQYDANGNRAVLDSDCNDLIATLIFDQKQNPLRLVFDTAFLKILFIGPNNYIRLNQVSGSINQTTNYIYSYNEDDLPIRFQGVRNGELLVGNEYTYDAL